MKLKSLSNKELEDKILWSKVDHMVRSMSIDTKVSQRMSAEKNTKNFMLFIERIGMRRLDAEWSNMHQLIWRRNHDSNNN